MFYFGRVAMGRLPVLFGPWMWMLCVNRFGTLADSLGKTTVIANGSGNQPSAGRWDFYTKTLKN